MLQQIIDQRRICNEIKKSALAGKCKMSTAEHTAVYKCSRADAPLSGYLMSMLLKIRGRVA